MNKTNKDPLNNDTFHDSAIWQLAIYVFSLVAITAFLVISKM